MSFDLTNFLQSGAIISVDPSSVLIGHGCCTWKAFSEIDCERHALFFPDFFLETKQPWLQFESYDQIAIDHLLQMLPQEDVDNPVSWQNPYQDTFYSTFNYLQEAFLQSKLTKAVPYAFSYADRTMSQLQLKCSLKGALKYIQKHPSYIYGFWDICKGILGVTPEILFEYHEEHNKYRLSTVALAGTCPKGSNLFDFSRNEKELKEHEITINGIVESLQSFGHVQKGALKVLELPKLNHLLTPISVELKSKPLFEKLVVAMHPTPALGAYPRMEGMRWLRSYQEKINRLRYGAPVGMLYPQHQKGLCVVAIRNVQWDNQKMQIGAGCGVIPTSLYELEWKEIQLKMDAIRSCLLLR